MQCRGTDCALFIGFDAFLLSFQTNRMLLFTVSPYLCPPGQNLGISNSAINFAPHSRAAAIAVVATAPIIVYDTIGILKSYHSATATIPV